MDHYGVIDFGSNTIRLVVFELDGQSCGRYSADDLGNIFVHKIMAGTSSHVRDGVLQNEGIKRACKTLNRLKREASGYSCKQLGVFATAALRNCENSREAKQAIEERTGLHIEILEGSEEARLGFVGAALSGPLDDGVFIDVGGGSVEITGIRGGCSRQGLSLPMGSLSSFERFVSGILPTQEEERVIRSEMRTLLATAQDFKEYGSAACYAIGGSLRNTLKLADELFPDRRAQGRVLARGEMLRIIEMSQHAPGEFAHAVLRIAPDRLHTILTGCILADEVMSTFGCEAVTIRKGGIREGYLLEHMLCNA